MSWPQQPVAERRTCVRCHQSGDSVKTKSTCLLKDDFVVIHICCSLPPTLHCHIVTVWWPIASQTCDCFYPVVRLNHLHIVNFSSLITMHLILFLDKKGFICGWVSYFLYKNIVRHARLYGKKFMCIYIHTHMSINQMWQIKKVMSNHVFEECIGMNERMKWVWLACCVYNTIHTN